MNFTAKSFLLSTTKPVIAVKVLSILIWTLNIIKENCNFRFYDNKTDIVPTVLDGGNEIILANWPNNKHIIFTTNNDIPIKFLSHPYVLVNRSVLCNCSIESDNHYLLESLGASDNRYSKLTMSFTINMTFANYLDMLPNLTDSISLPLITNRTMYEQILPVNLTIPDFDKSLLHALTNLKDLINIYIKRKEIFDLHERHESTSNTNKNFFSNNHIVDIFVCFLYNFIDINNLDYKFNVQAQKDQNVSSKFGFAPGQRGRCHFKKDKF